MATGTLIAAVIVMALEADAHHDILVLDVVLFCSRPEFLIVCFMNTSVVKVTGFGLAATG